MKHLISIFALVIAASVVGCADPSAEKVNVHSGPDSADWKLAAGKIAAQMVKVEGGRFMMGCTASDSLCSGLEDSLHAEYVKPFHIMKYEVTQELWEDVMDTNPSVHVGCAKCPVEQVKWTAVQEFLARVNGVTGRKFRLPSGTEWEYAARGGQKAFGRNTGSPLLGDTLISGTGEWITPWIYAGSDDPGEVSWFVFNSSGNSHEVGQKKPNDLGLYDMSGNVSEWCESTWPHSNSKADKLVRGGGWDASLIYQRVFVPVWIQSSSSSGALGFRIVE